MSPGSSSRWYRDKPSDEVLRDALAMAARKRDEGCAPCAEAYLDLARRHGATEEQIRQLAQGRSASGGPSTAVPPSKGQDVT